MTSGTCFHLAPLSRSDHSAYYWLDSGYMRVSLVFYVSLVSGSHFSVLLRRTRDFDSIGSWFLERHLEYCSGDG